MDPMTLMMIQQMMGQQGQGGPAMVQPPPAGGGQSIPQTIPGGLFPPGGVSPQAGGPMPNPALAGQNVGSMQVPSSAMQQGVPMDMGQGGGIAGMMQNPALMHGLLGAGGALLSASGPSQVPQGLGQAMGGAVMGGLSGVAGYNAMQRQQEQDDQMNQILQQVMGGEMGVAQRNGAPTPPPLPQGVGTLREPGGERRRRLAGVLSGAGGLGQFF